MVLLFLMIVISYMYLVLEINFDFGNSISSILLLAIDTCLESRTYYLAHG